MLLYVLVLFGSLNYFQVQSYPYDWSSSEDSSFDYEEQGPRSSNEQQIDEIVNEIATCANSTLTKYGFMDELGSKYQLFMQQYGLDAIRFYVEMFPFFMEKEEQANDHIEREEYYENSDEDESDDGYSSSSESEEDHCDVK